MNAAKTLPIVSLAYELAYLEARDSSGMSLSEKDRSRRQRLREMIGDKHSRGRRSHRRFELGTTATIRIEGLPVTMTVKDLSAGGCSLEAPVLLPIGQRLKLSFEYQKQTFFFSGQVTRCEAGASGATLGVAFRGIPLEVRRFRPRPESVVDELYSRAS